jgi:hypothetical protein
MAPDLDIKMAPAKRVDLFLEAGNEGHLDVRRFKKVMERNRDTEKETRS